MLRIALHIFEDFLRSEGEYLQKTLARELDGRLGAEAEAEAEAEGEVELREPKEEIFDTWYDETFETTFPINAYGICIQGQQGEWDTIRLRFACQKVIRAALEEKDKTYRRILCRVAQLEGREEILNIGIWEAIPSGGQHVKCPKSTEFKMKAAWSYRKEWPYK